MINTLLETQTPLPVKKMLDFGCEEIIPASGILIYFPDGFKVVFGNPIFVGGSRTCRFATP
jgi:hypothetical protein